MTIIAAWLYLLTGDSLEIAFFQLINKLIEGKLGRGEKQVFIKLINRFEEIEEGLFTERFKG